MRKLRALLLLLLGALPAGALAASEDLVLVARVWGLAKYHHPALVQCQVDWDAALLDRWAAIEAAGDTPEPAIADLLAAAGETPRRPVDAATPAWIAAAPLSQPLREQLAWLAAERPAQQCYVQTADYSARVPNFDADAAYLVEDPDRAHRALAALRYWNAVEYFFPYKDIIGRDWADILAERLPAVLDAPSFQDYEFAMRRLTIAVEDSHAGFAYPSENAFVGAGSPPFRARTIEGRPVVAMLSDGHGPVQLGDEVLAVDGEPFAERLAAQRLWSQGSNPAYTDMLAMVRAAVGAPNPGRFTLRRPDGTEYEAELPRRRGNLYDSAMPDAPLWQVRALEGCRMGVLDLGRLQPGQVAEALDAVADTDALVLDVRNYPPGSVGELAARLYDRPWPIGWFTANDFTRPGHFEGEMQVWGGSQPIGYAGPRMLLFDERSISHAEYTVMALQADGRAITFGSQTAAADGDITRVRLPGGLTAVFTSIGVFYPDRTPTQRIGIVPDVHVAPTRAGLAAGRDEVLEAALDCRWLDERPNKRLPPQGLYFAEERSGEGIDVHHDASGTLAVMSYGYDEAGEPEWLLAAGPEAGSAWSQGFARHSPDGAPVALTGFAVDFHAGPYYPVCAVADQSVLHPRGRWQWPGSDGAVRDSCVRPLMLSASAASGMWSGPPSEAGWGVSLHHRDGVLAAVVYAYDGAGRPRWLMANGAWDGSAPVTLELQRTRGFCRDCPPSPVSVEPAGTLTLDLRGAQEGAGGNRLSIDARFADGSRWQREDMPLFQVTRAAQDPGADGR